MTVKNNNYQPEKSMGIHLRRFIAYTVLVFLTVLCLFWFYVLFINTTRSHSHLTLGFTLIPSVSLFDNIRNVMTGSQPIIRGMLNSLTVAGLCAALGVYFSTMTAFAIHAYEFKGKKFIFTYILMVMMIPGQVTALGFLRLVLDLKMENSFVPLVVPAIAAPVTFYYLKQYMESNLPLSLVEAARIDGSSEFRTFNSIVLPLMKPAIAVQAIFSFVGSWNNYFAPALILKKNEMKTLPILIAQLRSADFLKFDMGQVYASISLSIFPVIIVYLILSKHIVQGIAVGSVKG